jgi:vitamin B12 transport system substrate-binding protein
MKTPVVCLIIVFLGLSNAASAQPRVITLAPHLGEIVALLQQSDSLVAVSEASDHPEFLQSLPTVANYRGINIAEIVKLQPTHILAWHNGNKAQEIAKLQGMGLNVLTVEINTLDDIAKQIEDIGAFLGNSKATEIAMRFRKRITQFQLRFAHKEPIEVFYYSWPKPLQSIGSGAWVTKLLEQCGLTHVFASLPLAYPQVSLSSVLQEQAPLVIAATGEKYESIQAFWAVHERVYQPKIIIADPDKMHRFTPRVLDALEDVCRAAR